MYRPSSLKLPIYFFFATIWYPRNVLYSEISYEEECKKDRGTHIPRDMSPTISLRASDPKGKRTEEAAYHNITVPSEGYIEMRGLSYNWGADKQVAVGCTPQFFDHGREIRLAICQLIFRVTSCL